jgi:hypothetical protein
MEGDCGKALIDNLFLEGGQENISPVLNVPRQCTLVLLVQILRVSGINIL